MRFMPLTEEEIERTSFLPDGLYEYQVTSSEDKVSKAGNDYLSLTLRVFDSNGSEHIVFTNLALIKLLKHFCDANNLQEEYKAGDVPAHKCLNKSGGKVQIGFEDKKPNDSGGFYKAKNIVKDYIVIEKEISSVNNSEFKDSDIPF